MNHRKTVWMTVLAVLAVSAVAGAADVAEIVAKLPADNAAAGQPMLAQIAKLGPGGVKQLCGLITPPSDVGDAKARYALHGLVLHTKRRGAEAERAMVEGVLLAAIAGASDEEVKAFFIRQVQLIGSARSVAPLGSLLASDRLCEPAAQALLRIRTGGVAAQFRRALPAAKGKRLMTIVQALGLLRDKASAKAILACASADEAKLRHTAWYALADIADARATKALAKAAASGGGYERALGTKCYLQLARRLAEDGDEAGAAAICRDLLAKRTTAEEGNVQCAALHVLVGAVGAKATGELLGAVDGKNVYVREAALKLAEKMPGEAATRRWAAKAAESKGEVKAAVVAMLARRGDKSAVAAVKAATADEDATVRAAAMEALARLDADAAAETLLAAMKSEDRGSVDAASKTLAWVKSDRLTASAAAAIPTASVPGRVALLGLLGARGARGQAEAVFAALDDKDAGVRQAAIRALGAVAAAKDAGRIVERMLAAKSSREQAEARTVLVTLCRDTGLGAKPLLAALGGASGRERSALLGAMARIGGPDALSAVMRDVGSTDEATRDAAIRALADWQDPAAASNLLAVARDAKTEIHRVLTLRGCVRLLSQPSQRSAAKTAGMYKQALAVAGTPAEKKAVLAGLGKVRSLEALRLAGSCLDDPSLTEEAAAAAVAIACPRGRRDKGLRGPVVREVLGKVVKLAKNKRTVEAAGKHIGAQGATGATGATGAKKPAAKQATPPPLAKPDSDGFISLLNGKDLTGWVGSVNGYGVEDGVMFCKPRGGGNLFTAHQFGDFILKFDFIVPPGGNNGLGIRSPLKGNPAYVGMELQILDNKAPQYARLRPVQYHGSIYDVVAAKRGFMKPAGEWNTQEVRALGSKITVILNGTTIVDADLDEVIAAKPQILKRHPGLARHKGHIGFLGHGARVQMRNIRIKPFPPYTVGPHNKPPAGFTAAFNGKDLTGWKGLVGNPKRRAVMTAEQLAAAQEKADENMRKHWKVDDGTLVFDGKGGPLCTAKDYEDFEMYVDWKIHAGGDSGIYLRGSPQVQIWDPKRHPEGSGGLYNNQKNPRKPLVCADNPPMQWNRFRIKMIGERVWVWLNGELVVDNTVMENYWERGKPIYPSGQIELQNHGSTLWFRNVYIREIPREKKKPE